MPAVEASAGWVKFKDNPVLGGGLGTCFDVAVLKEGDLFRMWFSWRPKRSVALVESSDGVHWSEPSIVLSPNDITGWENRINRPVVLKRPDGYHMWYTGQTRDRSWIGYATSHDGKSWVRMSDSPVLSATEPWEKESVMAPHVLWDEKVGRYKMWYSGGGQYEPDAIGYATSPDGRTWLKHHANPIFRPDRANPWEQSRVAACQVIPDGNFYLMFYIGFRNAYFASIGIARSQDGINDWERHADNPVIRPGVTSDSWDYDSVYKPFALLSKGDWYLWYNGRRRSKEQIGLAIHPGGDLWLGQRPSNTGPISPKSRHTL